MKLLKSKSFGAFQSGIAGSFTTMGSSIIVVWSKLPYASNPYMGLLKSIESSMIIASDCQFVRDRVAGSIAGCIKPLESNGASCFTGDTIWDWRGKGLFIGGVGGALGRLKGSVKGIVLVVGVPPYEELDEAWSCSESELIDPLRWVYDAPFSRSFCCMRLQSSSKPS